MRDLLNAKKEAEMKNMQAQAGVQNPQVQSTGGSGGGITTQEKKDFLDSIELLKKENEALQKAGGNVIEPKPSQQVFRSLMLALGRAKQIIATMDERGKNAQQQQADLQQNQQDQ